MRLKISDPSISFARDVPGVVGPDRVLLDEDDNLIASTPWAAEGFTVQPFLDPVDWGRLRDGLSELVRGLVRGAGKVQAGSFGLEDYHRQVAADPALHAAVARQAGRGFPVDRLPIDVARVIERIAEITGVSGLHPVEPGSTEGVFNLRLVRPQSGDNNPLHRDVWLDRLRNAVNLYVPLAGSDASSSLALVPGSHLWSEAEIARTESGALIDGVRYTVPSVVGARQELRAIRPDPRPNEVLVFSPYLIHGGATNPHPDRTRVSLEMRFWRGG